MSRISSRFALFGVGAVLVVAGVAGCGSSDDSSEALTKDDYIAQANEICAGLTSDIEGTTADFGKQYQAGDYEAASISFSDINDQASASIDELKALTPPEEDQATIDKFLELQSDQIEMAQGAVDDLSAGDDTSFQAAIKAIDSSSTQSDQIADDYGMTECGSAGNS